MLTSEAATGACDDCNSAVKSKFCHDRDAIGASPAQPNVADESQRDLCALRIIADSVDLAPMSFSATCVRSESSQVVRFGVDAVWDVGLDDELDAVVAQRDTDAIDDRERAS